jgi:hypothetical protein
MPDIEIKCGCSLKREKACAACLYGLDFYETREQPPSLRELATTVASSDLTELLEKDYAGRDQGFF